MVSRRFPFRNHPSYNDLEILALMVLALAVSVVLLDVAVIMLLVKVW
jgi:hypothetical protein